VSKHTQGPWHRNIKPATKYNVVFAGRNTHIAKLETDLPSDGVEGNCNLIATAPDLLEVCKVAVERLAGYDGAWEALSPAQRSLVNLLKETIQKAEGNKI